MKILKMFLLAVVLALAISPPIFAQTATTRTILNAALAGGSANTSVTLLSVTGITASGTGSNILTAAGGQTFCIIGNEVVQVKTVNTSTNVITVARAAAGLAVPHQNTEPVYCGVTGTWNSNTGDTSGAFVALTPHGSCTRTSNQFLPVINRITGEISDCLLNPAVGSPTAAASTTGTWSSVNYQQLGAAKPYKKLAVSATTYTLLPTDYILGYNTNVAGTITVPALTGWVGKEYVVQLEITGSTSLTIAPSSGQSINGSATSIIIGGATSFGGVYMYTDGANWFARRSH